MSHLLSAMYRPEYRGEDEWGRQSHNPEEYGPEEQYNEYDQGYGRGYGRGQDWRQRQGYGENPYRGRGRYEHVRGFWRGRGPHQINRGSPAGDWGRGRSQRSAPGFGSTVKHSPATATASQVQGRHVAKPGAQ